jgi:hypothetical protein
VTCATQGIYISYSSAFIQHNDVIIGLTGERGETPSTGIEVRGGTWQQAGHTDISCPNARCTGMDIIPTL